MEMKFTSIKEPTRTLAGGAVVEMAIITSEADAIIAQPPAKLATNPQSNAQHAHSVFNLTKAASPAKTSTQAA